jgi:L-amino acid N-acyltransferase YncA
VDNLIVGNSELADMPTIANIYTNEVLTGLATFETNPQDVHELIGRRQQLLNNSFPYLVACID